jgi:hypothetical protein
MIVDVPVVIEPVVVPVPLTIVPAQIQDVTVTIRVPKKHIEYRLYHHPLKPKGNLWVESYSAFKMP